jgi:hypothetical protein
MWPLPVQRGNISNGQFAILGRVDHHRGCRWAQSRARLSLWLVRSAGPCGRTRRGRWGRSRCATKRPLQVRQGKAASGQSGLHFAGPARDASLCPAYRPVPQFLPPYAHRPLTIAGVTSPWPGRRGLGVVENLKRAVSWLVVFAVGLAPMLVYWGGRGDRASLPAQARGSADG